MRGRPESQTTLFYNFDLASLIPANHPLRAIRAQADAQLQALSPRFTAAYAKTGRPSIPPEQLIKASLLQALYSIRSERQLCEQISYNFLFRWFVGLDAGAAAWDPTTFTKNRERFSEHGLMQAFFESTVAHGITATAAKCEDFAVDGTLIRSWASLKSVRRKGDDHDPSDSNGWQDFSGEKRSNATHESRTDPEARMMRKGDTGAYLSHSMHFLMEQEAGVLTGVSVAEANGRSEREEALRLIRRQQKRFGVQARSLAADKGYDAGDFLLALERAGVRPAVALREGSIRVRDEKSAARARMARRQESKRYRRAQKRRKAIEQIVGWMKEIAGLKRVRVVGRWKIQLQAWIAGSAYNLMRVGGLRTA
jgi:transposase